LVKNEKGQIVWDPNTTPNFKKGRKCPKKWCRRIMGEVEKM
jgi:hypothetical protein